METIYDFLSCVSNRKRLGGALKYFFVLLTLVFSLFAGFSSAQAATHTVRFVYECEGTRHECAVMTRETGAPFAFLPQNPFCAGKNFNHWVNDATDAVVDESTTVNGDMVVRAVYDDIHLYTITVDYYYIDCNNGDAKEVFDQAAYIIDGTKVTDGHPYQITSPAQTNVPVAVQNCTANATDDIFYPEEPTISITSAELAALGSGRSLTKEVKYVPFTATYSFVYKLKNLTGNGYTEIDRENNVHGVKNSTVTATVKNFDYAEFESTTPTLITEASGQEIDVLYTRKNFLLSFNTNGGTPVNAIQSPYGSEVTIPSSNPTRTGYTFAGWYLDEDLTQPAGNKVTLNADRTLYAKWTGNIVNYTIVYMKEKYNNQTGTSDWVYDNSKTGSGTVGDKVYAYSAPDLTNNIEGYEKDVEWNATSSITIAADGSAVLTVRYRLIRYTIVFNINRNNGRIKIDGREYKNSEYVVNNVVLGMDVSHVWPSSSNEIYSNNSYFAGWNDEHSWNQVTKVRTITYEYFENANDQNVVTWKAIWENRGNKNNVEYWFQQPNGEYQVDPYYTEVGINVSNTGLGHKEFDGYTFYNGTPNGYQGNANNQTVTVEVTEYDFADTYTDGGGHQVAVPENTTLERNGYTYTFSLSSAQTQTRSTSGHASANPNPDEQEIVVGGITYAFVGSQADEHCIEVDGSIKNNWGSYQRCTDPEPEITRNGHTYLFKETTYTTSWGRRSGCTHHYCYTDYTYNYAYTTYTYTWVCREGAHTVQYSNRGYTYRFYYDRIKYNIDYYYGTEKLTTKEVMFGANINTATYNYTPTKPANMDADYTWGGWKSDANLTTDYTFDVMPGNNLSLYACWNAPKYTVTFNLNYEGASDPYYSQTVEKYKVATDPGLPSRAHYVFEGWYTDPVGGTRYSVGEQVTSDVTLYAHWQLIPLEYTVKYLEEGTNNELFTEKTVKSPAFTLGYEVTEQALTIAGYMPDNAEKRLALDYEGNVITFFYVTKPESNKYKVRYLLKDSNISVHEESDWVTVPGNTTSITVLAANVDKTWMGGQPGVTQDILAKDYYPEEAATTFQLGKDGESNVFTIYYLDYKSVIFNITSVDMCGNPLPGVPVLKVAIQPNAVHVFNTTLQNYTYNKSCTWDGQNTVCAQYVSDKPVYWEAPDGPSSLEVQAYFQKNLTITASSKDKVYDGTALRSEGTGDVTLLGLETGHTLSAIEFDGSVTNVSEGSVPTTPRDAQFTGACDSFYHIIYESGNLRIDPQNVMVALNPDRWTNGDCYNGVPRTIGFRNNGAEIIISSELYDSQHGTEIRTQASSISMTKTDAGTYTLPETDVLNGVRIPEDQNYNVTTVARDGQLVICPAELTVTTGSATKDYDGEPLTKSDEATLSGLVTGETATLVANGTQTNVGESDNTYTIEWGTAKESNYTIKEENLGTLKVNLSCENITLQTAADATDCMAEYTLVAPNTLDEGLSYFYKINDGEFAEFTEGVSFSFSDSDSIVWQAQNNGSVFSTCTQTVRVEDGTKPVIALNTESKPDGYDWGCNPTVVAPQFTFSDNCDGEGNVPDVDVTSSQSSNGCQVTETWTANYKDAAGNEADPMVVSYTWTEAAAPTIADIDDVTATPAGHCTYTMPDLSSIVLNHTTDGCDSALTFVSQDREVGYSYTQESEQQTIPVTVTVRGGCGLTQTATVNVIIPANDLKVVVSAPTAGCPGEQYNFTTEVTGGTGTPTYVWSGDAEGTSSSATITTDATIDTKTYTATVTVTDANGCAASDEKTLTVEDKTIPTVTGTFADVPATANIAACNYIVPDLTSSVRAQASDNCTATEDLIITQSPATGDVIAATSEVTVIVTDKCGNANESTKINVTVPAKPTITITPKSDSKSYDGTPLSAVSTDYTTTGTLMAGDKLVASATEVSITNVGTEVTTIASAKIMRGAEDVTCYYEIVNEEGFLTVTNAKLEPVCNSGTKVYDGSALTTTASATGVVAGETIKIEYSLDEASWSEAAPSRTAVGTTHVYVRASLANYDTAYCGYDLTVTPLDVIVTIVGNSKTVVYDGVEHDTVGYVWSANTSLYTVDDFKFTGDSTVSGENVGIYPMNLDEAQFENVNPNFGNVTFNITDGELEITPREDVIVTITKHSDNVTYNGEEHTVTGYDFDSNDQLYIESYMRFNGEVSDSIAKGINVGSYGMTFDETFFENINDNFKDVKFVVNSDDSLVIKPLEGIVVTITEHADTFVYDGESHMVSGYEVAINNGLYTEADFTFIGDSTITGTDAGSYSMPVEKTDFENINANFKDVEFVVEPDTMVITPRENVIVTITKHSDNVTYNGEEHTVTGYDFDSNDQLYIESYMRFNGEVSDSIAKGINVGSYGMTFDETFFENINDNFKDVKFEVNSDDSLIINPLHVLVDITGLVDTVTYDALAHSVYGYEWNASDSLYNTADYFSYEGDSVATGTDVNTYMMGLKKDQFKNTNNNFDVEFSVTDGWLTIKPLDVLVNITGHVDTVIYNGSEQAIPGYEWIASDSLYNTADYFTYAGDSVAKGTTVGTYPMGLEAGQFSNTNDNFNVTFKVTDGWLTINRLDIIVDITGHTNTVTYNGVEQAIYGYEWDAHTDLYTENDFIHQGDSVAAGTTIGTYPMGLEFGQFTNVNENFTVSFNLISDGWLTINKITTPITITAFSSTMVYDGGELTDDEFRFTRNVLVAGDELFADVEGSITNVGSVPNVVTGYRVLRDGVDVTENYTFNPTVEGTLTVTRRPVTFTSATDEKVYDGTPLTNTEVTVTPTATGEGFVRGEGVRFNVTGTITEIGTADNTFTFTPNSNTDTANYDITVVFGKLTINKIETPIEIIANSNSKTYDGTPLTESGFTFTDNVLAEGDSLIVDIAGSITDFGMVVNKVTGYRVVRGDADVTQNYTFGKMTNGTLSIMKRFVTLISATDSKVYDRTPLTNSTVSVGDEGFVEGEGAIFQVTGTITDFGTVDNMFTYELKENTKADNYDISTIYGKLSITKRPTAIVFNYGYDDKADTLSGYADEPYTQMADPVRTGYDFKGWDGELPTLLPLDTLTVTAQWSLITYEIQLDTFETITYTVEDHKIIDLNDHIPYYEGYDFMGWRNQNGEIVTTINTDDAGSVELTATWHIATYNITYISNGKTLKTVPVVFADPIPEIADPVREGYSFKGWSPEIPETMPEGGLTVTAQWGLITYQLTLEDNGKVVGVYEYTVEDEFFYIEKIEDREGMRFDGWMLNGELLDYDKKEGKYIFFPELVAGDVSITAKWTTVTNEFNLIYKVDGVTYHNFVINAGENTAAYVASVQDPVDKRGYMFNGWDMDVPETMPRKDVVINAVWKPIVYTITLRDVDGEEIERINYTIEKLVQLPTYPEKDGQVFLGWSDGLNTYYEIKPGSSAEDFELTATWGVKSFEIIYIVDGIEYARDTIQAGAPLVKISDPETTEEGYAFSGWSATPDIMPAHDLTVTGSFEKGGYTLTYIIDGEVIKTTRYLYGAAISPAKAPNRVGYEFDVWEGLPATMPAHDLSVTGTYKIATYSIVLRNEGVAIDTIYYTIFDDVIALPVIDGPGKMFKGWYDGRKTVNRINPKDYSGNIDLVASWIYFNFTVTFYVDDAQYSRNNSMRYGDVIQLPEEPTKEGLYFIRWDGMPADGLMPENDLKLYAVFSDNPDDVSVDMIEDAPTVDVYTEVGEIVVLRAENMDIQVMDFDGVTLFSGKSNAEKFSIPVRYRGAYIVRINNQFRKVLVR